MPSRSGVRSFCAERAAQHRLEPGAAVLEREVAVARDVVALEALDLALDPDVAEVLLEEPRGAADRLADCSTARAGSMGNGGATDRRWRRRLASLVVASAAGLGASWSPKPKLALPIVGAFRREGKGRDDALSGHRRLFGRGSLVAVAQRRLDEIEAIVAPE